MIIIVYNIGLLLKVHQLHHFKKELIQGMYAIGNTMVTYDLQGVFFEQLAGL